MAEWKTIEELFSLAKGSLQSSKNTPGEYPFITAAEEWKTHESYTHDCEAMILAMAASGSLGRTHYIKGRFISSDLCFIITPKRGLKLDLLFYYRLFNFLRRDIVKKTATGTSKLSINRTNFGAYKLPYFDYDHQMNFRGKIETLATINDDFFIKIQDQLELINKLRWRILQEAIEGKLTANWRKQHPDLISGANHASKLLEKIKSDRERLIKEGKIRKEKHPVHISDEVKPFELPEGWVWCRLVDVCSKIGSGSTPRGSNYSEKGIPFFRSQNIHNDGIVYEDIEFISSDVHNQMKGTAVLAGDLLLNITGGSLGRCTLVPSQFNEGNVSQHVCIIRVITISSEFIHKLILSPQFQKRIFQYTTGAGREGLPKYNLEQFIIPLPPLAEQKAIVNRVDTLMRVISELGGKVSERKEQSEKLMQAVLREAFAMS